MLVSRKEDHLRISLEKNVRPEKLSTGLERYRLVHQALPELDLDQVNLITVFLGKELQAPLLISSMTGGTRSAEAINRRLAQAAQMLGVAMSVGSQRTALEHPEWVDTYRVRDVAPDILLLANLGAVQLVESYTVDHCRRAVEMIEADGLILHLNPLQEALQPGGGTRFAGLLRRIAEVCRALPVPVVVKEVGYGLSSQVARKLVDAGVSALDVAGAGGTSWSEVERYRIQNPVLDHVAAQFDSWGIPTVESIRMVRWVAPEVPLIASGGIHTGIDVAKCLALGANLCGLAWPLLRPALLSDADVVESLEQIIQTLRIAMFCVGAQNISTLEKTDCLQEIAR